MAAMYGRNSVGYELNYSIKDRIVEKISSAGSVKLQTEKRHDCIAPVVVEEEARPRRPRQSLR